MSQNNQKLVNNLESFFADNQAINFYTAKEFNLKEIFSNSILVKNSPGGSSGGDCWGGYTSRYDNSQEEQISELYTEIKYKLDPLAEIIGLNNAVFDKACSQKAQEIQYSEIGSDEDSGGDYYGNYIKYCIFEVNIINFFKPLISEITNAKINDFHYDISKVKEKFESVKGFAANFKQKQDVLFVAKVKTQRQQELEDKIKNFDDTKKKAKDNLYKNITHYRESLNNLTSQLDQFEEVSNKELKKLKSELTNIQETDSNPSKVNKAKKVK